MSSGENWTVSGTLGNNMLPTLRSAMEKKMSGRFGGGKGIRRYIAGVVI